MMCDKIFIFADQILKVKLTLTKTDKQTNFTKGKNSQDRIYIFTKINTQTNKQTIKQINRNLLVCDYYEAIQAVCLTNYHPFDDHHSRGHQVTYWKDHHHDSRSQIHPPWSPQ